MKLEKMDKEVFLRNVEELYKNFERNWKWSDTIDRDLSVVDFDYENYTGFNDKEGYFNYPVGLRTLFQELTSFL